MRMKAFIIAAMAASIPTLALAEDPPRPASPTARGPGGFGSAGQISINSDIPLDSSTPLLFVVHESSSMGGPSTTTFGIQPSLDYFVIPGLSVGGALGIARSTNSASDLSATAIAISARLGYALALSPSVSLWPRLGLGYTHLSLSGGGAGGDASGYVIPLVIFVPVLWEPTPHFFLGAGPVYARELVSHVSGQDAPKATDYGIQAMLGGYFGGT